MQSSFASRASRAAQARVLAAQGQRPQGPLKAGNAIDVPIRGHWAQSGIPSPLAHGL